MTNFAYPGLSKEAQKQFLFVHSPHKMEDITNTVFAFFKVDKEHINSGHRGHEAVQARQVSMYIIRKRTHFGLKRIATFFSKDHSTVIYACETVQDIMDTNKFYRAKVEGLLEEFK